MSIFAFSATTKVTVLVASSNWINVCDFLWRKPQRRLRFGPNEISFDLSPSGRGDLRTERLRLDEFDYCQWRSGSWRENWRGKPSSAGCRRRAERERKVVIRVRA